jgi:hypothetical protein
MKNLLRLSISIMGLSWALAGHAADSVDCKVKATFSSAGSIGEAVAQEIRQA